MTINDHEANGNLATFFGLHYWNDDMLPEDYFICLPVVDPTNQTLRWNSKGHVSQT